MKKKLLFFLIVCCITFYACNNISNASESLSTICKNWQLETVYHLQDTIQLNTSLYRLTLNIDSSFSFNIEDNILSGKYATAHENLLLLKTVTITDVCCNTSLGKQIEAVFSASALQYSLLNDSTLLLHAKTENKALKFSAIK